MYPSPRASGGRRGPRFTAVQLTDLLRLAEHISQRPDQLESSGFLKAIAPDVVYGLFALAALDARPALKNVFRKFNKLISLK